jgi:serine protease Do
MRRLPRLVAETPVDKSVPVTLWRKHALATVRVKVGRLEETDEQHASARAAPQKTAPSEAGIVKTLGMTLSGITPELKDKYSLGDDAKGVVVVNVAKDSSAADKGFQAGDLIMEAAQEEVKNPEDLASKIAAAKKSGRKSILLLVQRQGDLRFVALRVDQG